MPCSRPTSLLTLLLLLAWLPSARAEADQDRPERPAPAPPPVLADIAYQGPVYPIDLATALRLAGVQNPEIQIAQERVVEAIALRQLAAVQFLPNLNAGTNVNVHNGTLQRAAGEILKVNRGSLYLGAGAGAVGAGTVAIPGVSLRGNLSEGIFNVLVQRQVVRQRQFASLAARNDVLLRVATAYLELLRAEGRRAVLAGIRTDAAEVARITANYARTGQGRQADADRAASEFGQRNIETLQAEADILVASARLAQLLDLDPAVRLQAAEPWVVPRPIVPEPIPLPQLIAVALVQRPELGERRAAIQAALLELHAARALPFSPNVILGYSAGAFGGGSNLAAEGIVQPDGTVLRQPRFDRFGPREDFDAALFWTARNLGVGNVALVRLARSNVRTSQLRETEVLDRVRAEVATAYARTHARYAQIETAERATEASLRGYQQDLQRTRNLEGLPIEVLDSLRLLARGRTAWLDAIIDYNRAHFDLYVALGQPPADTLARPVAPEVAATPEQSPPGQPAGSRDSKPDSGDDDRLPKPRPLPGKP